MSTSSVPPTTLATVPPSSGREEELADAAENADDVPAPARMSRERKLLERDAYGLNPDGSVDEVLLGQAPYEVPAAAPETYDAPMPSIDEIA